MKLVVLAGGYGTRISEESAIRPKPLVEIGDRPILWHIMKIYSAYGVREFVICCGHKGHMIKEYFAHYFLRTSDITFDLANDEMTTHARSAEPWRVTLVDTGEDTMRGGRLKRVREYLDDSTFCFTYGDCVANVDIAELLRFHREEGVLATLTAVQPPGRFGALTLGHGQTKISAFMEKPEGDGAWVNGGFFVLEPEVVNYIADDSTVWEREPLERLAHEGNLAAFRHHGFWHPMDTLRDRMTLEAEWASGSPAWRVW